MASKNVYFFTFQLKKFTFRFTFRKSKKKLEVLCTYFLMDFAGIVKPHKGDHRNILPQPAFGRQKRRPAALAAAPIARRAIQNAETRT